MENLRLKFLTLSVLFLALCGVVGWGLGEAEAGAGDPFFSGNGLVLVMDTDGNGQPNHWNLPDGYNWVPAELFHEADYFYASASFGPGPQSSTPVRTWQGRYFLRKWDAGQGMYFTIFNAGNPLTSALTFDAGGDAYYQPINHGLSRAECPGQYELEFYDIKFFEGGVEKNVVKTNLIIHFSVVEFDPPPGGGGGGQGGGGNGE